MQQGSTLTEEQILGIDDGGWSTSAAASRPNSANGNAAGAKDETVGARFSPTGVSSNAATDRGAPASAPTNQREENVGAAPQGAPSGQAENLPLQKPAAAGKAAEPPAWLKALLEDPRAGGEAKQFWETHAAYREAFATPVEARAVAELFPGGADEARQARGAAEELRAFDTAYLSGEPQAHAQLAAYLFNAQPRAFQMILRQAARVLAERDPAAWREFLASAGAGSNSAAPKGAATQDPEHVALERERADIAHERSELRASQYSALRGAVNDAVAGDVRGDITRVLRTALGADISDGARSRIADDIFSEIHSTLSADYTLTRQVGAVLETSRFDDGTRQQVAQLIAARAKALLPSVAKRVVADWTTSVLALARRKTEKQDAAARRVDIVGGGGYPDAARRGLAPREIDYRRISDEDILSL
jgi:hypothetical protein